MGEKERRIDTAFKMVPYNTITGNINYFVHYITWLCSLLCNTNHIL